MTDYTKFETVARAIAKRLSQPDEWEFIQRNLLSAYENGRDDMARDLRSLIGAQEGE